MSDGPQSVQASEGGDVIDLDAALDAELRRSLDADPSLPGIVARIESARHGLSWSGAVGSLARGGDAPLRAEHAFRIASVTKVFTAATAMRLVEDRQLDLFAPVLAKLSARTASTLAGNGHPIEAITLFQLLTHSAGLLDHGSHPDYAAQVVAHPGHVWSRAEQIDFAMALGPPIAPPGTRYSYSDTGYLVIGEVIENATGLPLAAAVRSLLDFDRLGLVDTYWEQIEQPPPGQVRAGQYYGDLAVATIDPSADLFGGGGLVSTTGDLIRFFRSLLRGTVFKHPETLTAGLMIPPVAIGDADCLHAALLRSKPFGGRPSWSHGGFWGVQVVDFADIDVTLAVSCNQVLCDSATAGAIGSDGLVDRLARCVFVAIDR